MHRPHYAAVVTLAAFITGCAANKPHSEATPAPLAAAVSTGAPAADTTAVPGVVIDDPGAEPRRLLTFGGAPGWKGLMKFRDDLSTTVAWQGYPPIDVLTCTVTQSHEIEQESVDGDSVRFRVRQVGAPTLTNVTGEPGNVHDAMSDYAFYGREWTAVTTTRFGDGFSREAVQPKASREPHSGGAPMAGDASPMAFLPRTPVGAGARWRCTQAGAGESRTITVKLDSLSADEAQLSYEVRIVYSEAAGRSVEAGGETVAGKGGVYTDIGTCCWHDGYPTWRWVRGIAVGEIRMDAKKGNRTNSGVYSDRRQCAMELERR